MRNISHISDHHNNHKKYLLRRMYTDFCNLHHKLEYHKLQKAF